MEKVIYLLGAGASANTIPIVNNMGNRINEIHDYLKKNYLTFNFNQDAIDAFNLTIKNNQDIINFFLGELAWLSKESSKHQTIDTLAKKYYLTSRENLIKLKRALIIYFTLEQVMNIPSIIKDGYSFVKKTEYRYDSFFAALLKLGYNNLLEVNPNVKILTWNYDLQVELALSIYNAQQIESIKENYNIYPHQNSLNGNIVQNINNKFGVIKLNGNAIWLKSQEDIINQRNSSFNIVHAGKTNEEKFARILEEFNSHDSKYHKSVEYFNFSWESDQNFSDKYKGYYSHQKMAYEIAESTEVLVIIGYSFPIFNRSYDKEIIDRMKKIKKIYIQDPNAESILSILKNGFKIFQLYKESRNPLGPQELPVQLEKNVDQFLIPFELS